MSSSVTHPVAFVAVVKDLAACRLAISEILSEREALKAEGVENLHFYTERIKEDEVVLAVMDLGRSVIWDSVTQSSFLREGFSGLEDAILPHPRNVKNAGASPWVQTETVCELRPANALASGNKGTWHAAVTGLRVEKEAEYRLLHGNVWPGVEAAIGKSNISRFDIFLVEFGDNQPYLFHQFQYTGSDFEGDMTAQSSSPVNQRWWKYTDACQQPLPKASVDSQWLDLKAL